ncbi:MAG: response regulator transcription factor [Bacteroidales bacterium]|nr:response regulator transcription factor [Bacteroidales bacterium]
MDGKIRTVLVDDDRTSMLTLESLLKKFFPAIQIVGKAENVAQAVNEINKTDPDLMFLDISLPDGEGFDVIEQTPDKKYEVIFITAYDQYAVKAFEFSALHYLVKPVTPDGLKDAIGRFKEIKADEYLDDKITVLKESLKSKVEKIIIPSSEGLNVVRLSDIMRLEADDVYTYFYLTDGQRLMASRPLNNYERILDDLPFSRIHAKHLVNLIYIKRYIKGKGGSVIMEDDSEVEVSVRKKPDFLAKLKNFARFV